MTKDRRLDKDLVNELVKRLGPPMSVRLDPDLKVALQGLADADERSLNSYINRALRKHVEAARKKPKTRS